jgi:hypothetical protein
VESPDSGQSTAASRDWAALLPIQILEDEVKRVRNQLTAGLQSVGRFNSNLQELQIAGSELAALAGIAAEHPEAVSWKDQARTLQDLAAAIEQESQEAGRTAYDAARVPFDNVVVLLDGGQPAGLEPAGQNKAFAEVADRTSLMKRMDRAFKWLRDNAAANKDFEKKSAAAQHEGAILAALAAVIATEGYISADEPAYREQAEGLMADGTELSKSAQDQEFAPFAAALARAEKRCNDCHRDYRFDDQP